MDLPQPYVAVPAEVVVGPDDETANKLAAGYVLWVRSIREGDGAMPIPGPHETSRHSWNEADDALVRVRVDTQFDGSPKTVTQQLAQLQEATAADELIVTTITLSHEDRRRSLILLAREWCATLAPDAAVARRSVG